MTLSEVRLAVVAALTGGPWEVRDDVPDALTPPVLAVGWAPAWLAWQTSCTWAATAQVTCFANRLTPTTGYETLEAMTAYAVSTLASSRIGVPQPVGGPQAIDVAGVTYLASRIPILISVSLAEVAHA